MKTPRLAYPYLRFSTAEQGAGDSSRRQGDWFAKVCDQEGWQIDQTFPLEDRGKSAFKGEHRNGVQCIEQEVRLELRNEHLQTRFGKICLQSRCGQFLRPGLAIVIKSVKKTHESDKSQHVDDEVRLQQIPRRLPHNLRGTRPKRIQQSPDGKQHQCQNKRRYDLNRNTRPGLISRRMKSSC